MQHLIPIILMAVAMATALNVLLRRFKMPTMVGYIVTGTVIGSMVQFDARGRDVLDQVAGFGIVFLMFTIGLGVSFSHLKRMKKEVLAFGLSQVVITTIVLASVANLGFGLDIRSAIIAGSALALSSTAIVLRMLNESGQIKSDMGRSALGIMIFQDMAVIPILLMLTIFTGNDISLAVLLGETVVNAVIMLGVLFVIGRFLLRHLFRIVSATNSREIYMGSVLLTVVGSSYLSHYFGFSHSMGAFIAGMMIADTIYKYQVEADLIPFRDLLLGVFFVSVGLQIDLATVAQNLLIIVLLGLALMLAKAMVLYLIIAISEKKQVALKTALALSQGDEFALVVLSVALASQMMDRVTVQILFVTVVLTMIATPYLISQSDRIVRLVLRTREQPAYMEGATMLSGHVVLLGFGGFGKIMSVLLEKAGISHVIITDDTEDYLRARELEKNVVYGDVSDRVLLQQVGVRKAMSTILALDDIDDVKRASASISIIDPNIKVIAKVPGEQEKVGLENFEHQMVLDGNSQTAELVVRQIQRSRLLAKETSELRYMVNVTEMNASESIDAVALEQKRLLELISQSFNAMREGRDIMLLKAFHESFLVLSEIIGETIKNILTDASLSTDLYEQINILLSNQEQLIKLNAALESLGRELRELSKDEKTRSLSTIAVEGLDAILQTLRDLAHAYSDVDMGLLAQMTSENGRGLSDIRQSYLGTTRKLQSKDKAVLASATNHMEQLRDLFGRIGSNYQKLAMTQESR